MWSNTPCLVFEGADVNAQDSDGETALFLLANEEGLSDVVKYLLDQCK